MRQSRLTGCVHLLLLPLVPFYAMHNLAIKPYHNKVLERLFPADGCMDLKLPLRLYCNVPLAHQLAVREEAKRGQHHGKHDHLRALALDCGGWEAEIAGCTTCDATRTVAELQDGVRSIDC